MNSKEARDLATQILSGTMFYGSFYYQLEDWLTECLKGNVQPIPKQIQGEYLKCALRLEVKDFFEYLISDHLYFQNNDYNDEDIEECVNDIINHKSSVLNMSLIEDVVIDYLNDKNIKRLEYLQNKEKVCPLDKDELYELNELERRY